MPLFCPFCKVKVPENRLNKCSQGLTIMQTAGLITFPKIMPRSDKWLIYAFYRNSKCTVPERSTPYTAPFLPLAFLHVCKSFLIITITLIASYLSSRLFSPSGLIRLPFDAISKSASFTFFFWQLAAAIRARLCSPAP